MKRILLAVLFLLAMSSYAVAGTITTVEPSGAFTIDTDGVATLSATAAITTTGVISGKMPTVINSDDATYEISAAQASAGTFFLATNAAGNTFTLPSAAAGMVVCVKNGQAVSQTLTIDTDGTDYIVLPTGARTSAAGDYYAATASASNQICLVAFDTTDWYVTSTVGTWAEE